VGRWESERVGGSSRHRRQGEKAAQQRTHSKTLREGWNRSPPARGRSLGYEDQRHFEPPPYVGGYKDGAPPPPRLLKLLCSFKEVAEHFREGFGLVCKKGVSGAAETAGFAGF